jgi:hypothetical protein
MTYDNGVNRNSAITELNGQMILTSTKESTPDTLRMTTLFMDGQGETSNNQFA